MTQKDYLIVGAGITGAVIARILHYQGHKKVMVVDKRDHIGGNCYSKEIDGLHVSQYGGHIFHTNNDNIWNYLSLFTDWIPYQHKVLVNYQDELYSFPINLMTLHQLWGVVNAEEAKQVLDKVRVKIPNPQNFEEKALSLVGEVIYRRFFYGYTKKQWNTEPKNLPASLLSRIPIRMNFNDNYFNAKYQAIPKDGYTALFEKMLSGIPVSLRTEVTYDDFWFRQYKKIIFTGPIDEYYGYCYGKLPYRSLKFYYEPGVDIGIATMNFTDEKIPYTRMVGFNYFYGKEDHPYAMREFPSDEGDPFYPIQTDENFALYDKYKKLPNDGVIFTGRLGSYQYIDMDQAVGMAMTVARKELNGKTI